MSHSTRAFPHEGRMKGWSSQSVSEKGLRLQTLSAKATMVLAKRGHPQAAPNTVDTGKVSVQPSPGLFLLGGTCTSLGLPRWC